MEKLQLMEWNRCILPYIINYGLATGIIQTFALLWMETLNDMNLSAMECSVVLHCNIAFTLVTASTLHMTSWQHWYWAIIVAGTATTSTGLILTSYATTFIHYVFTYGLIASIGMGMILPPFLNSSLSDCIFSRRFEYSSVMLSIGGLIPASVPLLTAHLLENYGFKGATIIVSGLVLNCLIGALMLHPHLKTTTKKIKTKGVPVQPYEEKSALQVPVMKIEAPDDEPDDIHVLEKEKGDTGSDIPSIILDTPNSSGSRHPSVSNSSVKSSRSSLRKSGEKWWSKVSMGSVYSTSSVRLYDLRAYQNVSGEDEAAESDESRNMMTSERKRRGTIDITTPNLLVPQQLIGRRKSDEGHRYKGNESQQKKEISKSASVQLEIPNIKSGTQRGSISSRKSGSSSSTSFYITAAQSIRAGESYGSSGIWWSALSLASVYSRRSGHLFHTRDTPIITSEEEEEELERENGKSEEGTSPNEGETTGGSNLEITNDQNKNVTNAQNNSLNPVEIHVKEEISLKNISDENNIDIISDEKGDCKEKETTEVENDKFNVQHITITQKDIPEMHIDTNVEVTVISDNSEVTSLVNGSKEIYEENNSKMLSKENEGTNIVKDAGNTYSAKQGTDNKMLKQSETDFIPTLKVEERVPEYLSSSDNPEKVSVSTENNTSNPGAEKENRVIASDEIITSPEAPKTHTEEPVSRLNSELLYLERYYNRYQNRDWKLLGDPTSLNVVLGTALCNCSDYSFILLTPLLLRDFNITHIQIALVMFVTVISDILSRILTSVWQHSAKIEFKFIHFAGLFALAASRSMFLYFSTFPMLVFTGAAVGTFRGIKSIHCSVIIPEHIPLHTRTSPVSLHIVAHWLVYMMLGLILGFVRDSNGNYNNCIIIINALTVVGISFCCMEMVFGLIQRKIKSSGDNEDVKQKEKLLP